MAENKYYKVLITTSGLGQRLGEITNYTNKSLVRVGKKPAISYIIESYPKNVEIVITTGHFGGQVKDFIKLAHPDRKFTFVNVDKYQGQGSSLGYSMLQAREHLQCPFVFHCGDTIVNENIPEPAHNWCGGFKGDSASSYSSFKVLNSQISFINEKGASDFDYLHIGLVGINDYVDFWNALERLYKSDPNQVSLNDCAVINELIKMNKKFLVKNFNSWFDVGNVEGLNYARKNIPDAFFNLNKIDESLFIFDDFVVKFFFDSQIARQRVERADLLKGLIPEIEGQAANFYRYKFVGGNLYSRVANPPDFINFLSWAKENLWQFALGVDSNAFKKACHDFYFTKTKHRIAKFFDANGIKDEENIINGEKVPQISAILKKIDFRWLCDAQPQKFHGDFILDNILKTENGYCLLDWRQNFGGLLNAGDAYYDLAKLNHNLIVNHDIIHSNQFSVNVNGKEISCDILRKDNLVTCQKVFHDFLKKEGYDVKKIQILTPLIWLNMSPLHHHPFNLFLFYFGKLNLWRAIKENQ